MLLWRALLCMGGSNWRVLDNRDAFISCARQHGNAHVMALVTAAEKRADVDLNGLAYAKEGPAFFAFIKKVDPSRSHFAL